MTLSGRSAFMSVLMGKGSSSGSVVGWWLHSAYFGCGCVHFTCDLFKIFRIHKLVRSVSSFQLPSCRDSSGANLVPFSIKLVQDAFIRPNKVPPVQPIVNHSSEFPLDIYFVSNWGMLLLGLVMVKMEMAFLLPQNLLTDETISLLAGATGADDGRWYSLFGCWQVGDWVHHSGPQSIGWCLPLRWRIQHLLLQLHVFHSCS